MYFPLRFILCFGLIVLASACSKTPPAPTPLPEGATPPEMKKGGLVAPPLPPPPGSGK